MGTPFIRLPQGTGFRLEFSEPVKFTVETDHFADPPTTNERFCGVAATTVPWTRSSRTTAPTRTRRPGTRSRMTPR
ncbi:hypothetical protein E4K10_30710 [Streptomyces sp. T1317-0309]|nr:hypothetical protein E4K10_30710 [Streptomyces sp. T1317-0309]